ncbi:MAG: hypothetical protein KBS59_01540, partial [Clostridiales bacterium]|nr:hypothetical protein [Clostridiales bacterium]
KLVYAVNTNKKVFVIYGGSGALFGFDGSQIDEALGGEYVDVNLGSNVNISSAFYFDWLSDVLDEDDVLLWSPEAGEAVLGRTSLTWYTYALNAGHYDILRYVDATKFTGLFNAYQTYAQNHSGSQQPFEKCSLGYTAYGDSADGASRVHSKEGSMYASSYNRVGGYFGGSMYKYCASLIKDMSDKGIHVYHAFAAMDKNSPDFAGDMTWINTYTEKLAAQFPGMTLVGDYKTSLVPTETLYDSEWHLIWDGAVQRTSKLVPELVSQMKEDGIIK